MAWSWRLAWAIEQDHVSNSHITKPKQMDQGYDQRTHTMELLLRDLLHYQRGADNNGA